ncbi:DUF6616 family protein [Salinimicrobium sp. GXAS 041]|uniref:DUF6616 family protein n=1 Tax=Salinimicrobium sp. GXAS 041 TaxID=3400806 RepID=UPI003C741613
MYLYVELWNVTQEWMDLSKEDRRAYMSKVSGGMKELSAQGIENVGWAMNEEHTPYRSDYRYMAVWKMPSLDHVERLEKAVEEAGWHKYFSQVNARGQVIPLSQAMENLINLEKHSTGLLD